MNGVTFLGIHSVILSFLVLSIFMAKSFLNRECFLELAELEWHAVSWTLSTQLPCRHHIAQEAMLCAVHGFKTLCWCLNPSSFIHEWGDMGKLLHLPFLWLLNQCTTKNNIGLFCLGIHLMREQFRQCLALSYPLSRHSFMESIQSNLRHCLAHTQPQCVFVVTIYSFALSSGLEVPKRLYNLISNCTEDVQKCSGGTYPALL